MADEKHPLEMKAEEVAGRPPFKERKTSEVLTEVLAHEGMMKMFHLLKTAPVAGRLLFLHPLDLFGREGRYYSPYLYYGEYTGAQRKATQISRALEALQIDYNVQSSQGPMKLLKEIGFSADEQEALGRDLADAFVYALVVLFRVSPALRKLVQSDQFDYKKLRSLVKDYSEIIDESELEDVMSSLFGDDSEDPELMSLLERLILGLVPILTRGSMEFLEMTKAAQSEMAIAYHQTALSFLDEVLRKAAMNLGEYTDLLDRMYLFGLIENVHTIFWCEDCSKEKTSYYEHHGAIAPSKMLGRMCPECNRKESFDTVFRVEPILLDSIFSRDHLLGVYLAWRLREADLNPELGMFVKGLEIDALVDGTLIECKSFKWAARDETDRENLEQTLLQMKKQAKALAESGTEVKRMFLLWNQHIKGRMQAEVMGRLGQTAGLPKVGVFAYDQMDDLIAELRRGGPA